jgi:hypothetical protein
MSGFSSRGGEAGGEKPNAEDPGSPVMKARLECNRVSLSYLETVISTSIIQTTR